MEMDGKEDVILFWRLRFFIVVVFLSFLVLPFWFFLMVKMRKDLYG